MRHDDGEARRAQQRALAAHVWARQQQRPGRGLVGAIRCAVTSCSEAEKAYYSYVQNTLVCWND